MAKKTLTRWQKATALLPLAVLSGAWTASLASTGAVSAQAPAGSGTLPDGTELPTQAIEAPASLSLPGILAPGVPAGSAGQIVASASTNGIPTAALAAYQRSAQVINAADRTCNISWQLIAAIGRVESDHGRYGGNVLTAEGVSKPGIIGIPLDGSNNTAEIRDTDGGQFDNDPIYDRAVGPMQFIPSTWSVVGVDADGDGVRNPQDIDDASLATAVYLCSGNEDLSAENGQRQAVFRYNRSTDYVNLVLSIMRAYQSGDYAAVPNSTSAGPTFYPAPSDAVVNGKTRGQQPDRPGATGGSAGGTGGTTDGGSTGSDGDDTQGDTGGSTGGVTDTVDKTVQGGTGTVTNTLTPLEKATQYCTDQGVGPDLMSECTDAYLAGGEEAVQALLEGLGGTVGGLLP